MKITTRWFLLGAFVLFAPTVWSQESSDKRSGVGPPDFVPYEKAPVVISKVEPVYPALAVKSGLEGNVFLKVWVNESGSVVDAAIIRTDQEVFNGAALEAAKQWKFKPAVLNGKPVAVWVSIPFRFRLKESVKGSPEKVGTFTMELQSIATNIIHGDNLEKAKISIDPEAYVIDGNHYESLWGVLTGEIKTCRVVEGPKTTIPFSNAFVTDDMSAASIVLKSVSEDGKRVRYHSVLFVRATTGEWKVKSWHVSG